MNEQDPKADDAEELLASPIASRPLVAIDGLDDDSTEDDADHLPPSWRKAERSIKFCSLAAAFLVLACVFIGWPLGSSLGYMQATGVWKFIWSVNLSVAILAVMIAILIWFLGQVLAQQWQVMGKALAMNAAAQSLLRPETKSVDGVRSVSKAVNDEILHLNRNLDDALGKLATAESMIRQQVKAIEAARMAMDDDSGALTQSVSQERENLMKLTEAMSAEADAFAAAIAENARSGLEQTKGISSELTQQEVDLQERLTALENTAERAFDSLEKLAIALEAKHAVFQQTNDASNSLQNDAEEITRHINSKLSENTDTLKQAKETLEMESQRLEELIAEQRDRAERLALALTQQTERLTMLNQKYELAEQAALAHSERMEEATAILATPKATRVSFQNISLGDGDEEADISIPKASSDTADRKPASGIENFFREFANRKEVEPSPAPQKTIRETRQGTPWTDILAAADDKQSVLDLSPEKEMRRAEEIRAPVSADEDNAVTGDVVQRIRKMQRFTRFLIEELYGAPPAATISRFEGGERNIFAHLVLRRNEEDVKLRIQNRAKSDLNFREAATQFLTEFDTLLEPATGAMNSETLLDDYLASPLGQVYILVGSALDYFA